MDFCRQTKYSKYTIHNKIKPLYMYIAIKHINKINVFTYIIK